MVKKNMLKAKLRCCFSSDSSAILSIKAGSTKIENKIYNQKQMNDQIICFVTLKNRIRSLIIFAVFG